MKNYPRTAISYAGLSYRVLSEGGIVEFWSEDEKTWNRSVEFNEVSLFADSRTKETTPPPFDITKLDCAGVFHEVPKKATTRCFYAVHDPWMMWSGLYSELPTDVVEFPRPDIANATIADLRARVTELETLFQRANDRAEFEYKCRVEAAVKMYEHYDNCKAELRRQLQAAWMRNDLKTADRIADLIGDRRPSEHEAADAGEVRA